MTCERCGKHASEGDRFCPECGSALAAPPHAEPFGAPEGVIAQTEASLELAAVPVHGADVPPPPLPGAPPHAAPVPAVAFEATAPPAPAPLPFAGFWRRFVALVLDATLLFFPQAILRVLMGLPVLSYDDEWGDKTALTAELFGVALTVLYCATLEASGGQGSLGQQMMGLAVTDTRGRRIGFGRALARQFGKVLSTLLCGAGYLLQLWNGKRQTLHDMMSGSLVLHRAPDADRASDGRMVVAS